MKVDDLQTRYHGFMAQEEALAARWLVFGSTGRAWKKAPRRVQRIACETVKRQVDYDSTVYSSIVLE